MTDLHPRVLACDGNQQETTALIFDAWLADNPDAQPRATAAFRESTLTANCCR